MLKLLYVVNHVGTFFSHRLPWARHARDAGWEVHVAAPLDGKEASLRNEGFHPHPLPFVRGVGRPSKHLDATAETLRIVARAKPDVAHLVGTQVVATLGPLMRGTRVPVICSITGLGHAFLTRGMKGRALRAVTLMGYRATFVGNPRLITVFQNSDDLSHVRSFAGLRTLPAELVRGSGVDIAEFAVMPEPPTPPMVVMLPARMLREKGVYEFVEAAGRIREMRDDLRFVLVGGSDPQNPSSVSQSTLGVWERSGLVECWGESSEMPDTLARSHIVVLPSYREGLPKVLLEAAAVGRAIVATDVPGCREIVRDGENGLLVPVQDTRALATAITRLADDAELRRDLARRGRLLVEREFSSEAISAQYLALYHQLAQNVRSGTKRTSPPWT